MNSEIKQIQDQKNQPQNETVYGAVHLVKVDKIKEDVCWYTLKEEETLTWLQPNLKYILTKWDTTLVIEFYEDGNFKIIRHNGAELSYIDEYLLLLPLQE